MSARDRRDLRVAAAVLLGWPALVLTVAAGVGLGALLSAVVR